MLRVGVCLLLAVGALTSDVPGVVTLDSQSFGRVVDGSRPVLVKVDEFLNNRTNEPLAAISDILEKSSSQLLLAELDLSDSDIIGDVQNRDVAVASGIDVSRLPAFVLFEELLPKGWVLRRFDFGRLDAEALLFWLHSHTGVHVGLPGTVKSLRALATAFRRGDQNSRVVQREKCAGVATESTHVDTEGDDEDRKYYCLVMDKALADPDWPWKEEARLERMLRRGGVTPAKRNMFSRRINVLKDF